MNMKKLSAAMYGSMRLYGVSMNEAAKVLHKCSKAAKYKLDDPRRMTVKELEDICRYLKIELNFHSCIES